MKKLIAILLAAAVFLVPTNPVLARAQQRDEMEQMVREKYQIPDDTKLEVEYIVQPSQATEDSVEFLAPITTDVALGCVLIVIIVTIVFFGTVIYIVYRACKPAPGQPNPPPPPPPPTDPSFTNTAPNQFLRASHSGGTTLHH